MSVGIGTISKGLLQQAIEKVANNPQLRPDFLQPSKAPKRQRRIGSTSSEILENSI